MSNLGKYQDFVTDAKRFGGVDDYLRLIEASAVTRATPRLVARSVATTFVVTSALVASILEAKRRVDARRELLAAAESARDQMVRASHERGTSTDRWPENVVAQTFDARICPACGGKSLQPFNLTAMKCSRCGALAPNSSRPLSGNNRSVCALCGKTGHDRRLCGVPLDATECNVCGFHGHDKETCLRRSGDGESEGEVQ